MLGPGSVVRNRYELIEIIGSGGMGVVWRGLDRLRRRPVAVKVVKAEVLAAHPEIGRRFFATSEALIRVAHPGLVEVLDVGDGSGGEPPCLVMEWIEGRSMREVAASGSFENRMAMMEQVLAAMAAAHAGGLVHRDLKPDNVMVLEGDVTKVLDFDLAKRDDGAQMRLTQTSAGGFGTPYYMAPEQAQSAASVDARADVYSLGAMLFEVAVGEPPPLKGTPPLVRKRNPAVSSELEALIAACLSEDAEDRPADAAVLLDRLVACRPYYVEASRQFTTLPATPGARGVTPAGTPRTPVSGRHVPSAPTETPPAARSAPIAPRMKTGLVAGLAACFVAVVIGGVVVSQRERVASTFGRSGASAAGEQVPTEPSLSRTVTVSLPAAFVRVASVELEIDGHVVASVPRAPSEEGARVVSLGSLEDGSHELSVYGRLGENADAARVLFEGRRVSVDAQTDAVVVDEPCTGEMLWVPGGTFLMGSTDGSENSRPPHAVTLSPYCMDRTEVTVRDYGTCVRLGSCSAASATVNDSALSAADHRFWSRFCKGARENGPEDPINCVDWAQADAYCQWVGARLPTEAEWEFAARGSEGRMYPWGGDVPSGQRLNALGSEATPALLRDVHWEWNATMYPDSDGWAYTAPVGSYPAGASPFGVMDLAGNVAEWTSDRFGAYPNLGATDPTGPSTGEYRVVRGGGWSTSDHLAVRATERGERAAANRYSDVGFRCARGVSR